MKMNKKYNRGFTLIELVLSVLIIGILSGVMLGIINIRGIQAKARDSQRIGDLKKIQTALELYFSDFRGYPESESWELVSVSLNNTISPDYINNVPSDPLVGQAVPSDTGTCFDGKNTYGYYYITNNCDGVGCLSGQYVLGAIVEVQTTTDSESCAETNNCANGTITCQCGGNYCYAVENPL